MPTRKQEKRRRKLRVHGPSADAVGAPPTGRKPPREDAAAGAHPALRAAASRPCPSLKRSARKGAIMGALPARDRVRDLARQRTRPRRSSRCSSCCPSSRCSCSSTSGWPARSTRRSRAAKRRASRHDQRSRRGRIPISRPVVAPRTPCELPRGVAEVGRAASCTAISKSRLDSVTPLGLEQPPSSAAISVGASRRRQRGGLHRCSRAAAPESPRRRAGRLARRLCVEERQDAAAAGRRRAGRRSSEICSRPSNAGRRRTWPRRDPSTWSADSRMVLRSHGGKAVRPGRCARCRAPPATSVDADLWSGDQRAQALQVAHLGAGRAAPRPRSGGSARA